MHVEDYQKIDNQLNPEADLYLLLPDFKTRMHFSGWQILR